MRKPTPRTKLSKTQVETIISAVAQRKALREYIHANLTDEALAAQFGVNLSTIERAIKFSIKH